MFKKKLQGIVLSNKAEKTLTVSVKNIKKHSKYKKKYNTFKKYYVHDESNEVQEGDVIIFEMCRPLSKNKKWRVLENLRANKLNKCIKKN